MKRIIKNLPKYFLILFFTTSCNDKHTPINYINEDLTKNNVNYHVAPTRLNPILDSITKIDIVEYKHVSIAGLPSKNYKNFEILKSKASVDELIALTNNKNATVSCYASWALADMNYINLDSIFSAFLNQERTVRTFSGCIMSEDHIANELYFRLWNNKYEKDRKNDDLLKRFDSIILFQNKPNKHLLSRALENRLYEKHLKERIIELAFDASNKEALFYINNWHKSEYYPEVKLKLVQYLKENDFKKTGTSDYYKTIQELLRYNDDSTNNEIIEKMKKDKHWHHDPEKFFTLLNHYSIYYFN